MLRPTRSTAAALLIMSLFAAAASCAKARTDMIGTPRCVSWKEEIGPLFAARCGGCHTGAEPSAGYDTSSYAGVLAGGSDAVPNAKAGDPTSRLVTTLDPIMADDTHRKFTDVFPKARNWVVDCDLSYVRSSIHPGGILDPASRDFHGQLIRDEKYAFGVCQKCHGVDFSGGSSGVSCLSCHAEGPTACATCHGAIASSESHARHLGGGPLKKTYDCGECHRVPSVYTDPGHIFLPNGELDPSPAEVTLGPTAALTPPGVTRAAAPAYDPTTHSCSDVTCHGALLTDDAATNSRPVWTAPGTGQADCGSCHGLPPNHSNSATATCVACHPSVVDKDRNVIGFDKHIDGKIDFGDPAAGCAGCHGGPAGPAPPPGLTGETSRSAPGVGAHQAHLTGASHLRGPIACNECHRVPAMVSSPGHFGGHAASDEIDPSPGAEVFPVDSAVGILASSQGAVPQWDRATATCSGVYCHGGGSRLAADTALGVDRTPVWTSTDGLTCGVSCHGMPPTFSPHVPGMTRFDCASCHPRTVDPSGILIISGAPGVETSAHINGVLDVAQ